MPSFTIAGLAWARGGHNGWHRMKSKGSLCPRLSPIICLARKASTVFRRASSRPMKSALPLSWATEGPRPVFLSHSDTACFRLHAAGAGHASVAHVSPVRVPARRRVAPAAARCQLGSRLCVGPAVSLRARPQRHPFVYEQQFGIVESDSELEDSSSQVHAVIESDLDVLMLQLKRDGATVDDYPPAARSSPPIASIAWPAC